MLQRRLLAVEQDPRLLNGGARGGGGGRQRFSYSTIAHAHGDRLLNVGLTRAIRRMCILFHPRISILK